jgi:hypothetical protein
VCSKAHAPVGGCARTCGRYVPGRCDVCCRCVSFLQNLAAITPNANELLAIADAVQQQQGLPPLQRPPGAVSESSSPSSPQQLLARLSPAAAVVLQQGVMCRTTLMCWWHSADTAAAWVLVTTDNLHGELVTINSWGDSLYAR